MARALGGHDRERSLGHRERAEQVGLEGGWGFGLAALLNRAEEAVTGVVDHHVEAAEACMRLRDRGANRSLVRDVQSDRRDLIAVALDEWRKPLHVPRCGGDPIAPRQRRLRPDATKTLRRTRVAEPNSTGPTE